MQQRPAPPPRATHYRVRAGPRCGTPDGVRRESPRVRTGDVTGTRTVSLAARLKTAGTPDRCELPMREGHVRRCVPGKRVLNGC